MLKNDFSDLVSPPNIESTWSSVRISLFAKANNSGANGILSCSAQMLTEFPWELKYFLGRFKVTYELDHCYLVK